MPTTDELIKRRIAEAEKAAAATSETVRALQQAGYIMVIDWIVGNIETDGNTIKYTAKNLSRVQGLYRTLAKFQQQFEGKMLGSVLDWVGRLIGLNADYFETFATPGETLQDTARRLTLLRWGFDTGTGKLIPGGYFEALFTNQEFARRVASLVNQAITQKMPLNKFQQVFKQVFVGKPGEGMLERHWKTNSFDLFQRIDRTANFVYAERLGLNYAIYSGTLEEDSRPFCISRVNKVFSRPEIQHWADLNFAGKPKIGYDPFTDCGGFNCRHHLSWISDGVAYKLRPDLKK